MDGYLPQVSPGASGALKLCILTNVSSSISMPRARSLDKTKSVYAYVMNNWDQYGPQERMKDIVVIVFSPRTNFGQERTEGLRVILTVVDTMMHLGDFRQPAGTKESTEPRALLKCSIWSRTPLEMC